MNSTDSGCVLSAVTIEACTGDSLCGCDSKMAHNGALFLCPLLAGGCDICGELAPLGGVGGLETTSSGVGGLVWTRVASSVGLAMLGTEVFGVVWEEMGKYSIF